MKNVTTAEAKELIASNKPVMIDFYADWCGPCKMLAPIVGELAEEYEGKIEIVKLNIDDESAFAMEHGVMSIPTLIGFNHGEIVFKELGYMPKPAVDGLLKKLL